MSDITAKGFTYRTPMTPTFIILVDAFARDAGSIEAPRIDIADLDDTTLREIAAAWTAALLASAESRRKNRKESQTVRREAKP